MSKFECTVCTHHQNASISPSQHHESRSGARTLPLSCSCPTWKPKLAASASPIGRSTSRTELGLKERRPATGMRQSSTGAGGNLKRNAKSQTIGWSFPGRLVGLWSVKMNVRLRYGYTEDSKSDARRTAPPSRYWYSRSPRWIHGNHQTSVPSPCMLSSAVHSSLRSQRKPRLQQVSLMSTGEAPSQQNCHAARTPYPRCSQKHASQSRHPMPHSPMRQWVYNTQDNVRLKSRGQCRVIVAQLALLPRP